MTRTVLLLIGALLVSLPTAPSAFAQAPCQFVLGFKVLHDLDPADTGDCLDNQTVVTNGDAQQHTTKGLLAWRKADNWTAFTNGYTTWINGPKGLASRLNTERFGWEDGSSEGQLSTDDQQPDSPNLAATYKPLHDFAPEMGSVFRGFLAYWRGWLIALNTGNNDALLKGADGPAVQAVQQGQSNFAASGFHVHVAVASQPTPVIDMVNNTMALVADDTTTQDQLFDSSGRLLWEGPHTTPLMRELHLQQDGSWKVTKVLSVTTSPFLDTTISSRVGQSDPSDAATLTAVRGFVSGH